MIKILKNQTASNIELDIGLTVPASGQLTLNPQDFDEAAASDDLVTEIGAGNIIVNNGSEDLLKSDGIRLIQGGFTNRLQFDEDLIQTNRLKIDVIGTLTDGRVKVSDNDSTAEFLEEKIVSANDKITVSTLNDGSTEDLQIELNPGNIDISELNNDSGFLTETTHDALPQDNPHNVTKTQVGLGNVDNTSDVDKPVSTAQQAALDLKYDASNPNGYETPSQLDTRDTANRNRANHTGTQTANTISDFTSAVQANETDTTIQLIGNTLRYVGENGSNQDIDLSLYLDDTNLSRIVSGTLDESTGIVTFTRDDSTTFTIDFSTLVNSSIELQNEVYVAKNGNDSSTNGSLSSPFLTVKVALDYIASQTPSATNMFKLSISPGIYNESPMVIPTNTVVYGSGEDATIITAADVNNDLFTMKPQSGIFNFTAEGVTGVSNALIKINENTASGSGQILSNVRLRNASNGFVGISSAATSFASFRDLRISSITGVALDFQEGMNATVFNLISGSIGTLIKASTDCVININDGRAVNVGIGVEYLNNASLVLTDYDLSQNVTTPIKSVTTTGVFKGIGCVYDQSRIEIADINTYSGFINSTEVSEERFTTTEDFSVGLPEKGRGTSLGEGNSYSRGLLVYVDDTGTIENQTSRVKIAGDGQFITGTINEPTPDWDSINEIVYVSTDLKDAATGDFLKFFGIRVSVIQALTGAGETVFEYWNGTSWIEFNTMSSNSVGQYLPYAKQAFERVGVEQIRFDYTIQDDWVKNDPVSTGTDRFWIRFRPIAPFTNAFNIDQIKIHASRTEVNFDGFVEYFGRARPVNLIPFDSGIFQAASNSPFDSDIYLSDFLAVGRIENGFSSNTTDRSGLVRPLPLDIDTSCPVRVILHWRQDGANTTPNYNITIRWAFSDGSQPVFGSPADAPANVQGQQTIVQQLAPSTDNSVIQQTFTLDVSEAISRRLVGAGDLFWFTVERGSDGNQNNLALMQVEFQYITWCEGGHQ